MCFAAATLNVCIAFKYKPRKCHKEGKVTSYCEAVNYLLQTYATDDLIAETYSDMMQTARLSSNSPTAYAEALWNKAH